MAIVLVRSPMSMGLPELLESTIVIVLQFQIRPQLGERVAGGFDFLFQDAHLFLGLTQLGTELVAFTQCAGDRSDQRLRFGDIASRRESSLMEPAAAVHHQGVQFLLVGLERSGTATT